jgi:thioredoxin 1
MDEFVIINEDNFEKEIIHSSTPVILEFGGTWCQPCKVLEPLLLQLGEEWQSRIKLAKLDVEDCPNLTQKYAVMSLPTTILFVDGQQAEVMTGLKSKEKIRKTFEPIILTSHFQD